MRLSSDFVVRFDEDNNRISLFCNIFSLADNQPGSIDLIEVQPFPIKFQSGASISVSALLTLDEPNTIPSGSKVRLDVKREGLIDLPIPCLELEGADGLIHLGSWY